MAFHLVSPRSTAPVPETISREADRLKADLVVVGSEGRDTLSEWVLGGVALRLVYVSRRPVTVVRPPRRRKIGLEVLRHSKDPSRTVAPRRGRGASVVEG